MNNKLGIRRLGLLLGVIGAALGAYASFQQLKPVIRFNRFESLVKSPSVAEEKVSFAADVQKERLAFEDKMRWYDDQIRSISAKRDNLSSGTDRSGRLAIGYALTIEEAQNRLNAIQSLHSDLRKYGIKLLHWTPEYTVISSNRAMPWPQTLEVESIETDDGEALCRTPEPSSWTYLSIVLSPILGFIVPWGLTQAVW